MSGGDKPAWLPDPLPVMPWSGDTYDALYGVFRRDLMRGDLTYLGFNVWFYPDSEEEGKETIFWHLTSREDKRMNPPARLPDPPRCARLNWVRAMLLHCPCATGDVLDWDHLEGDGAVKTYIWLHRHDFVIILKKLPDGRRRLITSFHLDNDHERSKMRKKWERRLPRPAQDKRPPTSGGPTPSTMGG